MSDPKKLAEEIAREAYPEDEAMRGYFRSVFLLPLLERAREEWVREAMAEEVGENLRVAERIGIIGAIEGGMAYVDAEIALFDRLRARVTETETALRKIAHGKPPGEQRPAKVSTWLRTIAALVLRAPAPPPEEKRDA